VKNERTAGQFSSMPSKQPLSDEGLRNIALTARLFPMWKRRNKKRRSAQTSRTGLVEVCRTRRTVALGARILHNTDLNNGVADISLTTRAIDTRVGSSESSQ
jgi:hypothetical protein